jgi:hypothetical protein
MKVCTNCYEHFTKCCPRFTKGCQHSNAFTRNREIKNRRFARAVRVGGGLGACHHSLGRGGGRISIDDSLSLNPPYGGGTFSRFILGLSGVSATRTGCTNGYKRLTKEYKRTTRRYKLLINPLQWLSTLYKRII